MATIRKRKKLWQVQIRRKDAPHISKSFRLKSDAEAWARQQEIEADKGNLKHDPRILNRTKLCELIERYLIEVTPRKSGAKVEAVVLESFLRNKIASQTLAAIKPCDFAEYRDERLKIVSSSTVKRQLNIIHHVYETAIKEWQIPSLENPLRRISKPKNRAGRDRRLKGREFESLIEAASRCRNKHIKAIIILAVETAMRRGEILEIRGNHADLTAGRLLIPLTKTGVPRAVPLSSTAIETLRPLIGDGNDGNDRIFPITPNALRLAWERIKKRTEVEDLHFHDLRHEAVSRLFERGFGVAHVAAVSGHKDYRMLARYAHVEANSLFLNANAAAIDTVNSSAIVNK